MAMMTPEQMKAFMGQAVNVREKLKAGSAQSAAKIPDGVSRYRILPSWRTKNALDFEVFHRYGRHFVKAQDRSNDGSALVAVTLCNKTTFGEKCPVCSAYWDAQGNKDLPKDIIELIKEANAGSRWLVNALHRTGAEPNKPITLDLPYGIGTDLFGDPKTGSNGLLMQWVTMRGASPYDLTDGTDIIIRKTGSGLTTKYSVELPTDPSLPVDPSVLESLPSIDDFIAAWKHSPMDEQTAVDQIRKLAAGGSSVTAALSAAQFAPPPATQPTVPATQVVGTAAAAVVPDVFAAPPLPQTAIETASAESIENLLADL